MGATPVWGGAGKGVGEQGGKWYFRIFTCSGRLPAGQAADLPAAAAAAAA